MSKNKEKIYPIPVWGMYSPRFSCNFFCVYCARCKKSFWQNFFSQAEVFNHVLIVGFLQERLDLHREKNLFCLVHACPQDRMLRTEQNAAILVGQNRSFVSADSLRFQSNLFFVHRAQRTKKWKLRHRFGDAHIFDCLACHLPETFSSYAALRSDSLGD